MVREPDVPYNDWLQRCDLYPKPYSDFFFSEDVMSTLNARLFDSDCDHEATVQCFTSLLILSEGMHVSTAAEESRLAPTWLELLDLLTGKVARLLHSHLNELGVVPVFNLGDAVLASSKQFPASFAERLEEALLSKVS